MSSNPCNLDGYFSFAPLPNNEVFGGTNLDVQLSNYPYYLSLGLSCADIRPDFDANASPSGWATAGYFKNGSVFSMPSEADFSITWPGPDEGPTTNVTWDNNKGFDFIVNEVKYVGPGLPTQQVSRGKISVGWIVESVSCQDGYAYYTAKRVFESSLSGFPIVIGSGDTVGFNVGFGPYTGPAPFSGTVECELQTTQFIDNVSGQINWGPGIDPLHPVSGVLPGTFNKMTGVTQVEALWCCLTAGYGCCGGGGANPYAPSFLIPPPTNPAPGEENATQPPIKSLLLLSNHTFQFPANFGVKKK